MSFTVGLLELLGYVVPGAVLLSVAMLVAQTPDVNLSTPAEGTPLLILALLISYIAGHLLTIVSRVLVWLRIRFRGHRPRRYPFYQSLERRLHQRFGLAVGASEAYHLSRQVVRECCPRTDDRLERLFALIVLLRNLAVAVLLAGALLAWAGHYFWAGVFALASAAFAFQHYRFDATHEATLFRAVFVHLSEPKSVEPKTGEGPKPPGKPPAWAGRPPSPR